MKHIAKTARLAAALVVGIFTLCASQAQTFLTNGLVAYYPLNGNANDASGNGINGTNYGAVLTTNRFGVPNSAYSFNGSSAYIDFGSPALLAFTNNFSVSSWCLFSGGSQNPRVICYGGDYGYEILTAGAGSSRQFQWIIASPFKTIASPSSYPQNQWYFVAAVVQGGTGFFFVNGALVASSSVGTPTYSTDLEIGTHSQNGSDFWGGAIDDVRFYNRALSTNEVAQLYAFEAAGLAITNQPATVTNNVGDNVVLSVGATSLPMDFHWYFSGTNFDNGTNSTLDIGIISQPYFGNYYVVVTNVLSSVTSSIATIYEPTTIISQPTNLIVSLQAPATFTVTAVGYPAPNYYQWRLHGTNIAGANSKSLTISSVTLSGTGNYQVLVSNAISSTNSLIATLDISPSITSPFIGATPIWGTTATLSVGAVGNGTLTYQWYFNGQAIAGAVYPQLNFSSIQLTNSGFYSVVVSSPYGSVTNAPYQVAVDPAVVTLGFYPGLTINGAAGNSYIIQRSANLSNATNWQTVSSLTLYQPVELWIDTSVDALSPFNNIYFYQVIPQ